MDVDFHGRRSSIRAGKGAGGEPGLGSEGGSERVVAHALRQMFERCDVIVGRKCG